MKINKISFILSTILLITFFSLSSYSAIAPHTDMPVRISYYNNADCDSWPKEGTTCECLSSVTILGVSACLCEKHTTTGRNASSECKGSCGNQQACQ